MNRTDNGASIVLNGMKVISLAFVRGVTYDLWYFSGFNPTESFYALLCY